MSVGTRRSSTSAATMSVYRVSGSKVRRTIWPRATARKKASSSGRSEAPRRSATSRSPTWKYFIGADSAFKSVDNVEQAERGRLFDTNPGPVRVKGNFFHHNRHGAGDGYGVESAAGAYVTI